MGTFQGGRSVSRHRRGDSLHDDPRTADCHAHADFRQRQRKLSKEIIGRVKDKDGDLPNPMDTINNRTSYTLSNQKNIEVLRRIQELETDVMSLLNNRGIGVFDEEDFEEEEILIPR